MTATDDHFEAFLGDRKYKFHLTPKLIEELERELKAGVGAIFNRVVNGDFGFRDLTETTRLALIGGGLSPAEAKRLTDMWVDCRPVSEVWPVVRGILAFLWFGEAPSLKEPLAEEPADDFAAPLPVVDDKEISDEQFQSAIDAAGNLDGDRLMALLQ